MSSADAPASSLVHAPRNAEWLIALSGVMIACGGVLLGVQIDANGGFSGTGYSSLALGGLVALTATIVQLAGKQALPRDFPGVFAGIAGFLGVAFVTSGVLAPGGPWMFVQVVALLVLALRRTRDATRWLSAGMLWMLVALLLFRLWITYQGSVNHWQLVSIPIPILSWIPFDFLEPIQSVALGSFTPYELGLPPAGVEFPVTMGCWVAGFALCAAGLFVGQLAAREHENDRIHDVIHTLPSGMAGLVERILPEEEWERLGLHGLASRALCKRIELLVRERVQKQREMARAWEGLDLLSRTNSGGFSGSIQEALTEFRPRGRAAEERAEERGDER